MAARTVAQDPAGMGGLDRLGPGARRRAVLGRRLARHLVRHGARAVLRGLRLGCRAGRAARWADARQPGAAARPVAPAGRAGHARSRARWAGARAAVRGGGKGLVCDARVLWLYRTA